MIPSNELYPVSAQLCRALDESRRETVTVQLRLEKQIQNMEIQFLEERKRTVGLEKKVVTQTERADELQRNLAIEQERIIRLSEQIEALGAELEEERALKEDLIRELSATQARVAELSQRLSEQIRISAIQVESL